MQGISLFGQPAKSCLAILLIISIYYSFEIFHIISVFDFTFPALRHSYHKNSFLHLILKEGNGNKTTQTKHQRLF